MFKPSVQITSDSPNVPIQLDLFPDNDNLPLEFDEPMKPRVNPLADQVLRLQRMMLMSVPRQQPQVFAPTFTRTR